MTTCASTQTGVPNADQRTPGNDDVGHSVCLERPIFGEKRLILCFADANLNLCFTQSERPQVVKNTVSLSDIAAEATAIILWGITLFILIPPVPSLAGQTYPFLPRGCIAILCFAGSRFLAWRWRKYHLVAVLIEAAILFVYRSSPAGFPWSRPSWAPPNIYSRDHLGSIRDLIDSTGAVRARYIYDPTGRRTKIEGDREADFGFTGHYFHPSTGLHLAPYRAYDTGTARWLGRDPIGEGGGLNLYGYVGNNPINLWDPLGLLEIIIAPGTSEHTRSLAARGLRRLAGTPTGERLLNSPGTVTLHDGLDGLAPYNIEGTGDFALDPHDPLGVGRNAPIREFPGELPAFDPDCPGSVDDFLAVVMAHELGHAGLQLADPANVRYIENPVRGELGLSPRTHYHGDPIQ